MAGGKQKQPTVSTDSVAQDQIRAFVERIERIEEEVRDLNRDKSEVFGEAKGNGFDVKALKIIIGKRRQDHSERMELEAIVELYEAALGMANTGRYHANEEDERPSRARAHVEIIEQSGADDGDNEPAEHPAADADEQAHSSDAGSSAPINEPALTNTTADGEDGAGASVLATQSTAAVKERPYEAGDALGESLNERWRPCAIPKRVLNPPVDTSNVVTLKSYANDPPHPDCLKPSLCKGYSNIKLCQPCIDAAAGFVQVPHEGTIGR